MKITKCSLQFLLLQSIRMLTRNKVIKFGLTFGSLFLLWKIGFHFIWNNESLLHSYNAFSVEVIYVILESCKYLLELIGESVELDYTARVVRIKDTLGVSVGEPCIGYEVTAVYLGLIISSTGNIARKLLFAFTGTIIIYFLNLIRIISLAYLVEVNQYIWDVNHKFVFTLIIYSAIFLMWRFWLNSIRSDNHNLFQFNSQNLRS